MKWICLFLISFRLFSQEESTNEIRKISQLREEFLWRTNAYPNPSTGNVVIEGVPYSFVDILNDFGQLILTFQFDQSGKLEMQGMNSGIYLLRFRSEKECIQRRLVIQ